MNNQKDKVELLLPAGSLLKGKYALTFGADAVYCGVPRYALRTKENSMTYENVSALISFAHERGKQVYLTTNVYPHNSKLDEYITELPKLLALGADALILSDPGMILATKKAIEEEQQKDSSFKIPELHLSVQQNTVNYNSAEFWGSVGISRIILARELNLEEVQQITKHNPTIDFEYFIHGSICMSYSGRCLLSNYMTGRDANQGVCAQSCRWQYKVFKEKTNEHTSLQNRENKIEETINFYKKRNYVEERIEGKRVYLVNEN